MAAYYNEHDAPTAAWLRALIAAGLIADGEVDERSIVDVRPADLRGFRQCHFFAGIGGWSYALRLAGWADDRPVWTGSCPCQPFSVAGKGDGETDPRDLWPAWFQLVRECRPVVVFGEQVAAAVGGGWFDRVSADLETLDYAVGSVVLGAHSVGVYHVRQRLWFVADATGDLGDAGGQGLPAPERESVPGPARQGEGRATSESGCAFWAGRVLGDARCAGLPQQRGQWHESAGSAASSFWRDADWIPCRDGKARPVEPGTFPLADGVPARVGRLRGYGNAIVPQVAAAFIGAYCEGVQWP